jgi:DNA polymerase I
MLNAVDLPEILHSFGKVYVIDSEYYPQPGLPDGPVVPVALQAYEVRSGSWISAFFNQPNGSYVNSLDPGALYITFNAAAEWICYLSLGWPLPRNCIDFYIEFQNEVSALKPPAQFRQPKRPDKWKSSLLDVTQWCGFSVRSIAEKKAMRDRILRGHPFSVQERELILKYCRDDVIDTALVAKKMLPCLGNLPHATFRAHFMRPVAKIQRAGIPTDVAMYSKLVQYREPLKVQIISQFTGTALDIFEGVSMRYNKVEALVHSLGLESAWPKPKRKRSKNGKQDATCGAHGRKVFSTEVAAFEAMAILRPEIARLAEAVKQINDLKTFELVVGCDGRSRYPVFPFGAVTGRCTPSAKRFLLAQSAWTRGLIAPAPGWAIAYLDYAAAEILIAAVLSGDENMLSDYLNGDVYTNCAIRMGLAPAGSTKGSIGTLRDVMKVWLLSTLYGASPRSLHEKLAGSTLEQAEEFVRHNHESYARYWAWSDRRTEIFIYETGVEETAFGWRHHLDKSERFDDYLFWGARNRSRNFPMQATCAEILRWACVLASDDGVTIHAPLHDAVLIGAPDAEIEDAVIRMRQHMTDASRLVLGVEMRVPVPNIIRYPDRMRDPRGAKTWDRTMRLLDEVEKTSMSTASSRSADLSANSNADGSSEDFEPGAVSVEG